MHEPELHGDISGVGVKVHSIADCPRAIQWHPGIQGGAKEVHSLLAMGVPATIPLWDEQQENGKDPWHPGYLSVQCPAQAACSEKLLLRSYHLD